MLEARLSLTTAWRALQVLAFLALLLLVAWQHQSLQDARERLGSTSALLDAERRTTALLARSLAANEAAAALHQTETTKNERNHVRRHRKLDAAVESAPAWGTAPVPDAVFDSLFQPANEPR